jgi:hypothetical protein
MLMGGTSVVLVLEALKLASSAVLGSSLILLNTSHSPGFLKELVSLGFRVGGELMGIMKEPITQGRFFDQQI